MQAIASVLSSSLYEYIQCGSVAVEYPGYYEVNVRRRHSAVARGHVSRSACLRGT